MHDPNPFAPPAAPYVPLHYDAALGHRLATRGTRFRAVVLDGLVTFAVVFPTVLLSGPSRSNADVFVWISILAVAALWIYQWVLISTTGQSLGKRWTGIRIVKLDGSPVGFVSGVLLRSWLMQVIAAIPMIGGFLGLLDALMIFGGERRCLHDHLAGTKVIDV